jgi:hypothetical protein
MTVAALIVATQRESPQSALERLVEVAWSGGAHPILVAGLSAGAALPSLAVESASDAPLLAGAYAQTLVAGTSAIVLLPLTHAGVDPETVTTLIAAHGRQPRARLAATWNGVEGVVALYPLERSSAPTVAVECGDEAAVTPSDGRTELAYEAPLADTEALDPWEQHGATSSDE